MDRWEYMYVSLRHDRKRADRVADLKVEHVEQIEAILNAWGKQGWEVVNYGDWTGMGAMFLLKRKPP